MTVFLHNIYFIALNGFLGFVFLERGTLIRLNSLTKTNFHNLVSVMNVNFHPLAIFRANFPFFKFNEQAFCG
jgi:hypothetical protein